MRLLAIDPGEHTGIALAEGNRIVACYPVSPSDWAPPPGPGVCLIEYPQVHGGTKDPASIVRLAFTAGRLAERARAAGWDVREVFPVTWKGSVPKPIHQRRIRAARRPGDCEIPKSADACDAFGLAAWGLQR